MQHYKHKTKSQYYSYNHINKTIYKDTYEKHMSDERTKSHLNDIFEQDTHIHVHAHILHKNNK